jgi:hypothetical protein
MRVEFGQSPPFTSTMVEFLMVDTSSTYNAILERKTLNAIGVVISPTFLKIKFHTSNDIREECGHQMTAKTCYVDIRDVRE